MEEPGPRPCPFFFLLEEGSSVGSIVGLWVSLALVALSVAAETALRNFRWSRLEQIVRSEKRLQAIKGLMEQERAILDGLISLRMVATFMALLALMGFFAPNQGLGPTVDLWGFLGDLGLALLVILGGIYGLIRGVVRAEPERTLVLLLRPARVVARLLAPVVWLITAIGNVACRALGLQRSAVLDEARHEILDAVTEGERGGAIDDEGREMIENIIDVQDQEVSQIMTPRTSAFAIAADTPFDQAVSLVVEQGHSRVPVYEGTIDNVQGILYAKDLLAHWSRSKDREHLPVLREVMRPPLFVPETKKTADLLNDLRRDHVHMAIVLDEYGGMSGLVTIEDILEEIVGEIEDEYDRREEAEAVPLRRLNETEVEVAGRLHIDELNEALHLALPEDEGYDTIGGFISTRLGRVPEPGEVCDFENVRFEVLDADARRINRVKVVVGA